jgi:methylmalonyl-CoA mutase C-terminal domain/subunit
MTRPIKMIVAKVGLDGHDRGAKAVALAMRDFGFEIIYTGLRQTPETVVAAALEEDAEIIGVSLLSGAHVEIMGRINELLVMNGLGEDTLLVLGGNVPLRDHAQLRELGVHRIFSTDSTFADMGSWLIAAVHEMRRKKDENDD